MRMRTVLIVLWALILDSLKGACPTYQKFAGTTSTTCSLGNSGVPFLLNCDQAVANFAIAGWLKLSLDDSLFSEPNTNTDVFFSVFSPAENYRRLIVEYNFGNGLQNGLKISVGDVNNPSTPTVIGPVWSDDSQTKYNAKRDHWVFFMVWMWGTAPSKQLSYRVGETTTATGTIFYETLRTYSLTSSPSGATLIATQDDLPASNTYLYIGGYPATTATPVQPANSNYGGCGHIRNLVYLPNYTPSDTSDPNVLYNHMFEFSTNMPTRIANYFFRVKNINSLDLINHCDVPSSVKTSMQDTDNTYIKKGIQFGMGDYYECVNSNLDPSGDIVLSVKFYFSRLPSAEMNMVSLAYKSTIDFWDTVTNNGRLPVWFNFIKLGVFMGSDGKIKVYHMGLPHTFSTVFTANTGYTVTVYARRVHHPFYASSLEYQRLLVMYVNGVRTENVTMLGDLGAFKDVTQSLITKRNHYFYIGDFMENSINRYNYVYQTPNPLNSFGPNSTERSFSDTFMNLQDILLYENGTVSNEVNLLTSNCLFGVPGTSQCIICKADYVLDVSYTCKLKSSLASYTVYTNNHEATIECGTGLFFNDVLNICQNCPTGCEVCNSISDCVIKNSGCPSNCARCDTSLNCLTCNSGYVLSGSSCLQCQGTASCVACLSSNVFTCIKCPDGYFLSTGTSTCTICDPNCLTCADIAADGLTCTSCSATRYLSDGKCISLTDTTNDIYLWKINSITRNCFPTCKTCTNSEIGRCTSCLANYMPVYTVEAIKTNSNYHSCDSSCPSTHYYTTSLNSVVGVYCLPCETLVTNCVKCNLPSPSSKAICQRCVSGFFVMVDPNTLFTNTCQKCDSSCAECVDRATNCVSCAAGKMLIYNSTTTNFECVTSTQVLATTNRVCAYHKFLYKGDCFDSCPDGTYRRRFYTDDCASCEVATPGCFLCDKSTGVCLMCKPEYKKDASNNCYACNNNIQQCCQAPTGTSSGVCVACSDTNALECFTPTTSTICNTGFVLNALGVCKAVIANCLAYNYDASACLMCSGTMKYSGGACVASCTAPALSYISNSRIVCQACNANCSTCTKPDTNHRCSACAAANSGYVLKNNGCYQCPYYSNCGTWSATSCVCSTCSTGFLQSGTCYPACVTGFFLNAGTCSACYGCSSCSGTTNAACTTPRVCVSPYRLDVSATACCLSGQVAVSGSCSACNSANCDTCTSTAAGACTIAKAGYYLAAGVPVVCPAGFSKCKNANANYESLEACTYGSNSKYITTSWVPSCASAATATCSFFFANDNSGDKCAVCTAANYLDPTTFTCGACAAPGVAMASIQYKILGVTYTGNVCLSPLAHMGATFGRLFYYNVDSCATGYYTFKSGSKLSAYTSQSAEFELILCGKCHDSCSSCFDFSKYACTTCPPGKVLYMSTCLDACPPGYTDSSQVCVVSTCAANTYFHLATCTRKCPLNTFANNNTWTCDTCHADCTECWGGSATECRICSAASNGLALGDGTCMVCPANTYMDAHESFACSPYLQFTYANNMAASAPGTDPQLMGVTIVNTVTSASVPLTVDANSYLTASQDNMINFPTVTYSGTRTCYRFLVEFDMEFLGGSANWHNKILTVKDAGSQFGQVPINQWDFESIEGTYATQTTKTQKRFFVEDFNCTKKDLALTMETDVAAAVTWGVKNLRVYWFNCPLDCISCSTSISCLKCLEGKFFYTSPNECQVPYSGLKVDEPNFVEVYTFLFKPKSVFLYFNKAMNFTLGDLFPYFFPTFYPKTTRRVLQTGPSVTNVNMDFIGSNFLELRLDFLEISSNLKGNYVFRYPFVDLDRTGYNFTGIEVEYVANTPAKTFLDEYIGYLTNNKEIFRYVMTGVSLVMVSAMGANWLMIENCQKLYLLLFLSVTYSKDFESFLDLMDFSFFGWFQYLAPTLLSSESYWEKIKYDEYISRLDKSRMITKEFLDYIPPRKLGKYAVRKNFLVHTDSLLAIFFAFILFYVIFKPISLLLAKKYHYKPKLMAFIKNVNEFYQFKFFVRFVLLTFVPFIFYGLANISKIEFDKPIGMISAVFCFVFLGLWSVAIFQYFIVGLLFPSPLEQKTMSSPWRMRILPPFTHFMRYYKNPDDPYSAARAATEDDEMEVTKKFVNQHMMIGNFLGTNEVYTLKKGELKKGANKVYHEEKRIEDPKERKEAEKKEAEKKKKGFMSVERIKEMEQLEQEKKRQERQKEVLKTKDLDKEDKDGKKVKKDKEKAEKKEGEESSSSSEDEEKKDGDAKGSKKSESSSSSSGEDNTDESEEQVLANENVRNIGKLLGKAVSKFEKTDGCCACKRLRKNKCLNKFNYLMERSAKYYSIFRLLHMAAIAGIIWYFGDKPDLQVIILAASQTTVFVWTLLCRPYKKTLLNLSLILVEFCFTGLAWLIFLLQSPSDTSIRDLFFMICLILSSLIFVTSVFTFLGFFIANLIKWMNSLGEPESA